MNAEIKKEAKRRQIQRLCHFTQSANFLHVLESGLLKDRATLDQEKINVVNPTDDMRLDGHRDKICCTIEYPNFYYLEKAAQKERIFEGWLIVFLSPDLLWAPNTLFCERNAASQNGALIRSGIGGYLGMYSAESRGYPRRATHLLSVPTDMQAEVLISGPISVERIIGIAVRTLEQAITEVVRWDTVGLVRPKIPIYIAPGLFEKNKLRDDIWQGRRTPEIIYE